MKSRQRPRSAFQRPETAARVLRVAETWSGAPRMEACRSIRRGIGGDRRKHASGGIARTFVEVKVTPPSRARCEHDSVRRFDRRRPLRRGCPGRDPVVLVARSRQGGRAAGSLLPRRGGARRPPGGRRAARHSADDPRDIAQRLAILLGETPRPPAPRREIPDEDLIAFAGGKPPSDAVALWDWVKPHILRSPRPAPDAAALARLHGFRAFARDVVGMEPQDYQAAVAYCMLSHRSAVFVLGRQIGKDWIAALFATWESVVRPNARTLVVSEAQRQSDLLAERAMAFIARSAEVFDSVAVSTRERLRFRNGSEVYFLPSTGAIRGLTEVTRCIVNEARGVPDEAYEAVTPMLARLNGSLCLFSTPMGRAGKLFEFYQNPAFAAMQLPSSVNVYLDRAFLEAE